LGDLKDLFSPRTVAVIGASRAREKVGNIVFRNLVESGFPGRLFPINPKETEIEGHRAYAAIGDVPERVDLAVIALPAARVVPVAQACGEAGVKYLIVISAGFKETGHEGLEREKELVRVSRRYGMRIIGPNCVGVMDTHTPLNASFAAGFPRQGNIAFISQSGAMLVAILDWSLTAGLGFSRFVSLGNKGDLTESDFIADAGDDPNTQVILCYIEDVTDGLRFIEVCREVSRKKPIVILKSGSSQAGARAASSHTGALAGSDVAYETAFRQAGVIRAYSMAELFDLATAFSGEPIPRQDRVVIVTNAGGPGIVATDTAEQKGLSLARFGAETLAALRENLPPEANIYNPVDVLGDGKADRYRFALQKTLEDENTDGAIVLVCPTATAEPVETAKVILEKRREFPDKPIFAVYMGGAMLAEGVRLLTEAGVPCFTFPEVAVSAMSGLVRYAAVRSAPEGDGLPDFPDVHPEKVRRVLDSVKRDNRLVLLGSEGAEVAAAYGIPVAPTRLATKAEEAAAIAEELGYPVVLKVASPKIVHKTDIGGVRMGLKSAEEVTGAFWAIMENVQRALPNVIPHGIEVQRMAPRGTEIIIGVSRDFTFGPMIAFGLGGIYVNLLKDVAFRLAHGLTSRDIETMITETKAYTLLRGYRGEQPADLKALMAIVGRVARLVLDFGEIAEMDINPLFAYPTGALALDIKVTIS